MRSVVLALAMGVAGLLCCFSSQAQAATYRLDFSVTGYKTVEPWQPLPIGPGNGGGGGFEFEADGSGEFEVLNSTTPEGSGLSFNYSVFVNTDEYRRGYWDSSYGDASSYVSFSDPMGQTPSSWSPSASALFGFLPDGSAAPQTNARMQLYYDPLFDQTSKVLYIDAYTTLDNPNDSLREYRYSMSISTSSVVGSGNMVELMSPESFEAYVQSLLGQEFIMNERYDDVEKGSNLFSWPPDGEMEGIATLTNVEVVPTPLPASVWLLGAAVVGLVVRRRTA